MNRMQFGPGAKKAHKESRWNRMIDIVSGVANAIGAVSIVGALYLVLYIYDVGAVGMAESEYFLRVMSMLAAGAFLVIL